MSQFLDKIGELYASHVELFVIASSGGLQERSGRLQPVEPVTCCQGVNSDSTAPRPGPDPFSPNPRPNIAEHTQHSLEKKRGEGEREGEPPEPNLTGLHAGSKAEECQE